MKNLKHAAINTDDGPDDAGFTLIEMIVSLALLALMLALLPAALRLGREAWQHEARLERSAAVANVHKVLRRYLSSAASLTIRKQASGNRYVAFEGYADSVTFVATANARVSVGGLRIFRLALESINGASPNALVMRHGHFAIDSPWMGRRSSSLTNSNVVLADTAKLAFRYFGPSEDGASNMDWQVQWIDRNVLPKLIEITLQPGHQLGGQTPAVLIIRPLLGWS